MNTAGVRALLERHGSGVAAWLLVVLVISDRLRLMVRFAWQYTDKDQVLMWTAAHELLHGRVHEPRFYGQAYNSMLEGWLAAPMVGVGLPHPVAAPVITSALALLPFLALSACAWRRGLCTSALGVLSLPLLLPLEHGLVTSMPRGFVGGIAVAGVAACLLLGPWSGRRLLAIGFLMGLSISINPNAGIVVAAIGLYVLVEHPRRRDVWLWLNAGLLGAAALHGLSVWFYRANPANIVYGPNLPSALDFKIGLFGQGLVHAGRFLRDVTPAGADPLVLTTLFGLVLLGLARRRARSAAIALGCSVAATVLTLGLERVHVGSASVFWPWSRSYLAVPVLLGIGLIWLDQATARAARPARPSPRLIAVTCLVLVAVAGGRAMKLDESIEGNLRVGTGGGLEAWPVKTVRDRCRTLRAVADLYAAELVVFQVYDKPLAYACEPLLDGRLRTLLVRGYVAERRTWRIAEELGQGARTALLYNVSAPQVERARGLGVEIGPAIEIGWTRVYTLRLPARIAAFDTLAIMELDGAADLALRARALAGRK